MKIAVTGHTQAIGQSIADVYTNAGHEVVGFSRSNGFDISLKEHRHRIAAAVSDCDVFFNNAYDFEGGDSFAQTEMLFDIWEQWQGQHKTIVNISSSITTRWDLDLMSPRYRTAKCSLETAAEYLWNKNQWPFVSVVSPCLTRNPRTANLVDRHMCDPKELADLIYSTYQHSNFRVQVLKLASIPTA